MNQRSTPLWDAHKKLIIKNKDKFDVPIHKGGKIKHSMARFLPEVYEYDTNSSKPIDNLANPVGVIDQAHRLLAKALKGDAAFNLVNGTTSGIHAMMLSILKPGEKILVPRNIHKSALNAAIITGLNLSFMEAELDAESRIYHNITIDTVRESIKENPDAKAILILNPTYYGTVCDLKAIVEYAHSKGLYVICDEAHGSHFAFSNEAPVSAMEAGADMASMSFHKTGGSLTQSSVIVWKTERISSISVWNAVTLLQSTSPNYLLMSSIDSTRKYLYFEGKEMYKQMCKKADYLRNKLEDIKGIKTFKNINQKAFGWDRSKVLINVSKLGISGFEVYDTLSNKYDIQVELGETNVILLIVSHKDTNAKLDRFVKAIKTIAQESREVKHDLDKKPSSISGLPKMGMLSRNAFFSEKEEITFSKSEGRISADTMMFYPPGIPALIPGQIITQEIIEYHKWLIHEGAIIINNASNVKKVIVVKEKENE